MSTPVDIIIAAYNAAGFLRQCVMSLQTHLRYPYKLHVADDCSSSSALKVYLAELEMLGISIFKNRAQRRGCGRTLSKAIERTSSPLFCLLSSDTCSVSQWLAPMVHEMERHEDVGVVGALLLFPPDKPAPLGGSIQHAGIARNSEGKSYHIWRGMSGNIGYAMRRREVNAVSAACMLIQREVWDAVGGFDSKVLLGQFDVDFCYSVRKLGYKVIYQPAATLFHYEQGSGLAFGSAFSNKANTRIAKKWVALGSDEHLFEEDTGSPVQRPPQRLKIPKPLTPKPPEIEVEVEPEVEVESEVKELEAIPIVIPTYNAVEHLRRCVVSLKHFTETPYSLYVADDCSPSEELHKYLDELEESGQAVVLRRKQRGGFAEINNWAMKQVPSSFAVCLLNSDMEIKQPWLTYMIRELRENQQVGIVGARLVYPETKGSPWGGTIQHAGVARTDLGYPTHLFRGMKPSCSQAAKRREINAVTGACMLIRRELWDLIEGFDEGYVGGQFEDVDFCWTARELGWKVIYQPRATLLHYEHGSGEEWVQLTSAKNCQRLRDKWKELKGDEYLFQ